MDSDRASQLSGHAELLDPTRRRRRPPLSCLVCRRRKLKCDRSLPCAQCVKSKSVDSCTYLGTQAGSGSTRRSDTPPRSGFGVTGRTNPSGLHVFDSKREPLPSPKNTSTHLPELQELQELRSRVQTLENALCAPWAIPTPETWGGDGYSGVVPCVAPEDELIREHIDAAPEKYFRGRNSRTRVVGRCHWTLSISFFRDIGKILKEYHQSGPKDANGRAMKQFKIDLWSRGRRDHQQAYRDTAFRLEEMLPPRDVADELVRLYLTTFETTYRILHVPTFLKQYEACWSGGQLDVIFIAKLLALMAASSCFCSQTTKVNGKDSLHEAASAWIMAVQSWVASVFVIESIDFSMLQIQCLLLIACQATCADGDITWISAGSLVRSAMGMGLHRDTSRISHISKFWAEMRRRLWATICELELELSLDAGMTPSIDLDECDCGQPSDWDDEDLSENMVDDPVPKDFGQLSSNSIQTMLSRSLPVRFRIVKLISRLKFSLAYDEALRLTEELVQSMNEVLSVFGDSATGPARIDGRTFTRSFLIFLQRKYLLILHQPFFLNVSCSPKFSYSRKLCVESSMEMLSQLSHSSPDRPAPRLEGLGGGILRDELFRAATTLCVEMALQAEESHRSILSPSGGSNYMGPLTEMTRAQQSVMMQAVERTISIFRGLVGPRGKGSRAYIFLTMAVASVKARLTGEDPLRKVEEASVQVIQECKELMGMRVETRPGSSESVSGVEPLPSVEPGPTPLSSEIDGISPLEFGNLFDIYDYGMPELWDSGLIAGF